MKAGLVLCLLFTVLVPGLAGHNAAISLHTTQSTEIQTSECAQVSDELCDICAIFADAALNVLEQKNILPFDRCDIICGLVAWKTNELAGKICDILCSFVGHIRFKNSIKQADLDPIFFCKLLGVCATIDNGDANITHVSVNPKSGSQGEFVFTMTFKTLNGTGTGNAAMFINTVDGVPFSNSKISCYSPGTYHVGWILITKPDPACHQPPCEMWLPGTYNVTLAVCDGECDSIYSHSVIYDKAYLTFEITR